MTSPLFRFQLGGHTRGFAAPLQSDRVGLNFLAIGGGASTVVSMSAFEARAVANALFEAADAAEKVLPVVTADDGFDAMRKVASRIEGGR